MAAHGIPRLLGNQVHRRSWVILQPDDSGQSFLQDWMYSIIRLACAPAIARERGCLFKANFRISVLARHRVDRVGSLRD